MPAAAPLLKRNLFSKNLEKGSNKIENKNANNKGLNTSLPKMDKYPSAIILTRIMANFV